MQTFYYGCKVSKQLDKAKTFLGTVQKFLRRSLLLLLDMVRKNFNNAVVK